MTMTMTITKAITMTMAMTLTMTMTMPINANDNANDNDNDNETDFFLISTTNMMVYVCLQKYCVSLFGYPPIGVYFTIGDASGINGFVKQETIILFIFYLIFSFPYVVLLTDY